MSRLLKQFIYGVIYILIFGAIILSFLNPKEKNQKEEIPAFEPLEILGEVERLSLSSGRTIFFAEVLNPNENHEARRAPYRFSVYGRFGNSIEEVTGEENLRPQERIYIYESNVKSLDKDIYRVDLKIGTPEWVSFKELKPELMIKNVQTDIIEGVIRVRGTVENKSPVEARKIRILAVLRNKYEVDLFASETLKEDLQGFEEVAFSVSFPEDKALLANIEPKNTKILYSSE